MCKSGIGMIATGDFGACHKTIADFRKDNGKAIRKVCARFVDLCREMGLLTTARVAIDGSKFKAVNNRDMDMYRIERDKIVEAWHVEDIAGMLHQLGLAGR